MTVTADPPSWQAYLESSQAQYRQLVFDLAAGRRTSTEQIGATLSAAGRSADDLQRHLEIAQCRKQAADNLDRGRKLQTDRQKVSDALAAVNARLKTLREDYESSIAQTLSEAKELSAEAGRLESQSRQLTREAKRSLYQTRTPDFDDRQTQILRKIEVNHKRNAEDRKTIVNLKPIAADAAQLKSDLAAAERKRQEGSNAAGDDAIRDLDDRLQTALHAVSEIVRFKTLIADRTSQIDDLELQRTDHEATLCNWQQMSFE